MPKPKKIKAVEELKEKLDSNSLIIATGFQGLTVEAINDLRRRLRDQGAQYRVVKNTLLGIASDGVAKQGLRSIIQGPTGLVLSKGDPARVAKIIEEFIRTTRMPLGIRGAMLDGRVLTSSEVTALANLPSREELLARLFGQIQAPIVNLVSLLQGQMASLASVLQGRIEQLKKEAPS